MGERDRAPADADHRAFGVCLAGRNPKEPRRGMHGPPDQADQEGDPAERDPGIYHERDEMTAKADDNRAEKTIIRVDPEIAELIPGFLENRRKDIAAMLDAVQRGDFETVRILGHSMKGAGGGYGFDVITEIGAALEQAAKQRNAAEIRDRVHELSRYLDRVEVISD